MKDLYTKIIRHYRKTLKTTHKDEKILCAHGLEELISLKCPY